MIAGKKIQYQGKLFNSIGELASYLGIAPYDEPAQCIVQIENQPNNNLYDFLLDAFEHLSTFALIQMVLFVYVV